MFPQLFIPHGTPVQTRRFTAFLCFIIILKYLQSNVKTSATALASYLIFLQPSAISYTKQISQKLTDSYINKHPSD